MGRPLREIEGLSGNQKIRRRALRIVGVPEVDLVLDPLVASSEFEFLERQEHGEWLAVSVCCIEYDEGEAKLVAEFSCQVIFALGRAEAIDPIPSELSCPRGSRNLWCSRCAF